ncbi:CPBP family intramembrane metalloprotease [Psychrobacter sp. AH5]|uniref:CPBP family intramembrane glutamic endopeptidase n=1 Tax=Psychrobacter sp. AH5 TaxID=2937433 RepID=UPI00333E1914
MPKLTRLSAQTPQPLFSLFEAMALLVGMVFAFFASQLLGVYIAGRLLLPAFKTQTVADVFYHASGNGTIVSSSIFLSLLFLSALIVLLIRSKGGRVSDYLALKRFNLKVAIGSFGLLLIFLIGSQALTYLLDKSPSLFVDPLYQSVSSVWLLIIALVIVAPIYEELVFRGIIWSALKEQFSLRYVANSLSLAEARAKSEAHGALMASLITSLVFAIMHLQYGLYEISTIVLLAMIFCYARYKSGSLLLPILLHIFNNGLAMGQYLL